MTERVIQFYHVPYCPWCALLVGIILYRLNQINNSNTTCIVATKLICIHVFYQTYGRFAFNNQIFKLHMCIFRSH